MKSHRINIARTAFFIQGKEKVSLRSSNSVEEEFIKEFFDVLFIDRFILFYISN